MLVAADGVWSSLRGLAGDKGKSRFSGRIAWRASVRCDGPAGNIIAGITEPNSVTAFLHPNSHMVVYPLRGGDTINIVAVTEGVALGEGWSGRPTQSLLAGAVAGASKEVGRHDRGGGAAGPSGRSTRSRSTAHGRLVAVSR